MSSKEKLSPEETTQLRRKIREQYYSREDYCGWFEDYYSSADGNEQVIPWARDHADRVLVSWLNREKISGAGGNALVVGCGLGDDAQEIARRGFRVTAFDISATAISWSRRRFPESGVKYIAHDLFEAKPEWQRNWDFVYEGNTLQSLPVQIRKKAMEAIAEFPGKGGKLLVNCFGRADTEPEGKTPPGHWHLRSYGISKNVVSDGTGMKACQ